LYFRNGLKYEDWAVKKTGKCFVCLSYWIEKLYNLTCHYYFIIRYDVYFGINQAFTNVRLSLIDFLYFSTRELASGPRGSIMPRNASVLSEKHLCITLKI